MEKQRQTMTNGERMMFKANRDLVERQRQYKSDISKLISYIKGNKNLEDEVQSIIEYYTRKTELPTKYE